MSEPKPVVVYAASGYTGRLVCESLTRLRVPFVAAGRNAARLEAVAAEMRARGADCVATAAEHTPFGLRALVRGAKVVVNTSGPFSLLGREVVGAALAEGCHYVDSTGEQDFMLDMRREYGAEFERRERVLSPSAAFLWAPGQAVAEHCLDAHPGVDGIEVVYAPPSLQTVASLQSMIRVARRPGYAIVDRKLALLPASEVRRFPLPGDEPRRALRLGAGEAAFFLDDPRVRRCDTWFANEDLARAAGAIGVWARLSTIVRGDQLDRWSDALVLRLKKDPPPEEPETGRFVITVTAQGGGQTVHASVTGTSPYIVTGFLCAMAAQELLSGKAQRFGYRSLGQTFGALYVLARLREVGMRTTLDGIEPDYARPGNAPRKASGETGAAHATR